MVPAAVLVLVTELAVHDSRSSLVLPPCGCAGAVDEVVLVLHDSRFSVVVSGCGGAVAGFRALEEAGEEAKEEGKGALKTRKHEERRQEEGKELEENEVRKLRTHLGVLLQFCFAFRKFWNKRETRNSWGVVCAYVCSWPCM